MAKANFTTVALMGGGTLVEGTDCTGKAGRTILVSDRWDMYNHVIKHKAAEEIFSAAVAEVLAPITDAAERVEDLMAEPANEWSKVVISEGTEFEAAETVELDMDGIILRLLAETDGNLLRWIGDDTLVAVLPA